MKSICSSCGARMWCGIDDPARACWCTNKPKLLALDSQATCLCEKCFDERLVKCRVNVRCFRLFVSYLGTKFSGFQEQENARTVANELKLAIKKVTGCDSTFQAAGRTDAGVHAKGQVVSLNLSTTLLPRQLLLALASKLPEDMSVFRVDEMPFGFDARRQSIGKRYVYRIFQGLVADPMLRSTSYHVRQTLDVDAMQNAANYLVGEHDYSSFRASSCTSSHARRFIWSIDVNKQGLIVTIDIRGNAFCMNMVRIITGTLIDVGRKKKTINSVKDTLVSRDRKLAGATAPAHGLTLEEVYYPDDLSTANIPDKAIFPRYPVSEASWPIDSKQIVYSLS